MNPTTRKKFKLGDTVTLNRPINGKDRSFEYPKGARGEVIQIYHSSAIKVRFEDGREPVVASIYLR